MQPVGRLRGELLRVPDSFTAMGKLVSGADYHTHGVRDAVANVEELAAEEDPWRRRSALRWKTRSTRPSMRASSWTSTTWSYARCVVVVHASRGGLEPLYLAHIRVSVPYGVIKDVDVCRPCASLGKLISQLLCATTRRSRLAVLSREPASSRLQS